MTPISDAQHRQLARPVRLMYWLILIAGLALLTTTRRGEPAVTAALWVGAIGGTLIGQHFALQDYRLWISALAIGAVGLYCAPLVWIGSASVQLWLSFIPAALCGFWSLGDRSALAALWFPTVLWMLTILDRSDRIAPDGPAAILLGGLAGLVICFLCLRESRRVALWRSVAAEPLAATLPTELLREPPGRQLARAGWWLTVGALTVAITVWLVPPLWQSETLGGPVTQLADATPAGLPCCPVHGDADTLSSRVKEYLDLGLGHDAFTAAPREGIDCRSCSTSAPSTPAPGAIATGPGGDDIVAWSGRPGPPSTGIVVDMGGERATAWSSSVPAPAGVPSGDPLWSTPRQRTTDPPPVASPSSDDPRSTTRRPANLAAGTPPPAPDQRRAPVDRTPNTPLPPTPPPTAPASTAARPAPASPASSVPPPPAGATGRPTAQSRAATSVVGPSLLSWLAFAAVAALVFQVVRLGLRPLRRLVTVRHLRRPFWDETIAQRVSNAWQLALVGLRDAGWRTGPSEPPRDLARRARVDSLDRCAAILERARHGVGLDAGDLAEMQTSADAAYRAARTGLGGFPRVLAWLRWPLT